MAKHTPHTPGRSKVRLLWVEADLAEGDIDELTKALGNAIRPAHAIALRAVEGGRNQVASAEATTGDDPDLFVAEAETFSDSEEAASRPAGKPRKYRSPKVVSDLEPTAKGKSFESFAEEKGNPSDHLPRYLVATFWLTEFAGIEPATVDHIYTCYKFAGWTFDPSDPGFPFRRLKKDGYGDNKDGKFTINYIGRARVEKMSSSEA